MEGVQSGANAAPNKSRILNFLLQGPKRYYIGSRALTIRW